ncbi:FtsW/RodA/SpoVE family cell cycle protein [Gryllotalpicola ginsengisoli]|uniref:FtsW/RodA/SpoVE family cell cycle protein n=1 Tax=Gryllotalpicola ginsengisoli TaxID=444608 RepID=UPI0003B3AAC6|nr:FtsW/RodA/SpoVE family cell cycle protein [Gryllotalpicola ginsengisoli]
MAESTRTGFVGTMTSVVPRIRMPRRLRNLELGLLVFAFAIDVAAEVLVQLGTKGQIDGSLAFYGIALGVLAFGLHITLRFTAPDADPFILPIATVLNGIGIAEIYRIDIHKAASGWDAASVRQIVWTAIAIVCAIVVLVVVRNHRMLQRYTYLSGLLSLVLVFIPLLPVIGTKNESAKVWIQIGPLNFQPGEIAKITLAVFFAGYLVQRRESLAAVGTRFLGVTFPRARDLGPIAVIWLMTLAVILFERDLGTGLLYFGLFLAVIYVATGRTSWALMGVAALVGGAFAVDWLSSVLPKLGYVHGRFENWLHPFSQHQYDSVGGSGQLVQGLFGLAHGGLLGTGLGQGQPYITPVADSDYIVASIGEELGLIGLFAILGLYMIFVARAFRIGFASEDDFGKLLAVGLGFVVALQTFVVIGGITRVIPVTGLTAPFLAAGGSSLVANWVISALLLRLSDTVRNQPRQAS